MIRAVRKTRMNLAIVASTVRHGGKYDARRKMEMLMAATHEPAVYSELLDLLAESADPQRVPAFRLSDQRQARLDELLDKNREGTLKDSEAAELEAFERFEHLVRLLKARLLRKSP